MPPRHLLVHWKRKRIRHNFRDGRSLRNGVVLIHPGHVCDPRPRYTQLFSFIFVFSFSLSLNGFMWGHLPLFFFFFSLKTHLILLVWFGVSAPPSIHHPPLQQQQFPFHPLSRRLIHRRRFLTLGKKAPAGSLLSSIRVTHQEEPKEKQHTQLPATADDAKAATTTGTTTMVQTVAGSSNNIL